MEIVWEDPPVPEEPFFTRDVYDKYSLSPSIRELWAFLQSPHENNKVKHKRDTNAAKPPGFETKEEASDHQDDSCRTKEASCWESCDSDSTLANKSTEGTEDRKDAPPVKKKAKKAKDEADIPYPEPRLPFPCMSSLSCNEQKTYLGILMSKQPKDPPQSLRDKVNREVTQFMKYLQDVARICADDYRCISPGAMQYSEEFFGCSRDCMEAYPQLYQICEMTSLTGGTFNPGLALTFEKQLLIMGNVDITDHKIVPADAQLATDYQSVSSETPPAKKAKDMHATIRGDVNAEKLASRYEPHACLTRDALVRLLDNHGPDYADKWELPVCVKANPGKGSAQKKIVYVDSPLPKTEAALRERSHIYHEESLKLSIKRNGSRNVFHLMTQLPVDGQRTASESSQRNMVSFENDILDFEADLTDLETFGETATVKIPKKIHDEQKPRVKAGKPVGTSSSTKRSSKHLEEAAGGSQEEIRSKAADNESPKTEGAQLALSESCAASKNPLRQISAVETEEDLGGAQDSDDERLVINDSLSVAVSPATPTPQEPAAAAAAAVTPNSQSAPEPTASPGRVTAQREKSKRAKGSADQLGQILRMQTAMFSAPSDTTKSSPASQETPSAPQPAGPSLHSNLLLVKPCVSSYLERAHDQNGDADAAPGLGPEPASHGGAADGKKILSRDLQAGQEDEQDYEAPDEGNLLYKLYSLQDLLLMVRSSVPLTHTRNVGSCKNQHVPVHILPKLEYQTRYGVECLSSSEACRLWAETALHSSTVSYVAHIDALTSKVALLRKLPDDRKLSISCGFRSSKSLNILHHLLKKLTQLKEGEYLITHKSGEPFVTLMKTADGKAVRGAYNLREMYGGAPPPPPDGPPPWKPVDPAVVLPFHSKHGRPPCTFPPRPWPKAGKDGPSQPDTRGGGQQPDKLNANQNNKKKKKRKSGKRAAKRNKYIKNLIQKST